MRIFPQENLKSRRTEMQFPAFLASKRTLLAARLRAADIWLLSKTLHFTQFSSLIPTICSILGHVAIETIGDKSQGSANLRSGPILAVLMFFRKRKRK